MQTKDSLYLTIILLLTALPMFVISAGSPPSGGQEIRFQKLVDVMGCAYIDEKIFLNGQLVWDGESDRLAHKTYDLFPVERTYFKPSLHGTGSNLLSRIAYTRISVNQAEAVFELYTRSNVKKKWQYRGTMTVSSKNGFVTKVHYSGVSNSPNDTTGSVKMFMLLMFDLVVNN